MNLTVNGFHFTKTGLEIDGQPDFENWLAVGEFIKRAEHSVQLWLGDWVNYGEAAYGERYTQALEATDYEYTTLKNAAYVARNVDKSVRRDTLSFSHHQEVASLPSDVQDKLLGEAEVEHLTRQQLRSRVRNYKKTLIPSVTPTATLNEVTGEFQLILYRPTEELLTTFTKLCLLLADGGVCAVFSTNEKLLDVVRLLQHADAPYYWLIAIHSDSELIEKRNIVSLWQPVVLFRKSPRTGVTTTLKDLTTVSTLVETLADEAQRILVVGDNLKTDFKNKEVVIARGE